MPIPKRYFHVSQEINLDPDVWELTEEFGDRALRTWLQILVFLDRSENRWRMTGESLKNLSRIVRQQSASISRQVLWMISSGWLAILERSADGSPAILMSPNWVKYNRRAEHKRSEPVPETETKKERIETPSFPTPILSFPKEEEKKEEKKKPEREARAQQTDAEWMESLRSDPGYTGVDIDRQRARCERWCIENKKVFSRKRFVNWLNRTEQPIGVGGNVPSTIPPQPPANDPIARGLWNRTYGPLVAKIGGKL
jgi:hypothetical protein